MSWGLLVPGTKQDPFGSFVCFQLLFIIWYMAECIGNIHDSTAYPKLRTYKLFKEEFKFENYLSSKKNLNHTQALFRLSSNNLRIETGRYTRHKIPVNQRMCINCTSQAVETKSHFLLEFNLFIKERMDFLETVNI